MSRLVVSLFAGAGGLSTGFSTVGLRPQLAIELDRCAAQSYRDNLSSTCLELDLSRDETAHRIQHDFSGSDVFAVIGGPPCQGFSTAGSRVDNDPRNQLIFSYLSIIERLSPRWFVFENVEGLLTAASGRSVTELVRLFMQLGYSISLQKINCAGYGLPQTRKRVIIVGNRLGIPFELGPYTHINHHGKHKVSGTGRPVPGVLEALEGLGQATLTRDDSAEYDGPPQHEYDIRMRDGNGSAISLHYYPRISEADLLRIRHLKPGQSMRHIPSHLWPVTFRSRAYRKVSDGVPSERRGGAPHGLKRLEGEAPSLTITSLSTRELIHPDRNRPLTLRECARLQSFPDRYHFFGPEQSAARQIGNAVPPIIARFIADEIVRHDEHACRASFGSTLKFTLSDSAGRSPALAATEALLRSLSDPLSARKTEGVPLSLFPLQKDKTLPRLNIAQSQRITKARQAKPITLSDRELARLLAVLLHDLGHGAAIPSFVEIPSTYKDYYHLPLSWFVQDEQRPFDLPSFYVSLEKSLEDFETLFSCITQIHKRRRKFEYVIRSQPRPTMDQVARKGLLEFGIFPSPAITAWLVWRKWIFDLDGRAAQETGYLFDPILAAAVGGVPYNSKSSPIRRIDRDGARQVDCLIDDGVRKVAYEFKTRLTIASSGQGRWREEMAFPEEVAAAGFKPILLVLDPTDNDKLRQLRAEFSAAGGETYVGEDVWSHLEEQSSSTMKAFITRYVRSPIEELISYDPVDLPDAKLSWDTATNGVSLMIGDQRYDIDRIPPTVNTDDTEVEVVVGDLDSEDLTLE